MDHDTLTPEHDRDAEAFQSFVTGWLLGSLMRPDFPDGRLELELHVARGRWLPSFTIRTARHTLIVHVDTAIA